MAQVNLRANSRGILVVIITAVLIFFGCVLVYMGAAGKLKAVRSELTAKEKQLEDSRRIAQTLEESRLEFLDTRAQIRNLESSVSTQTYVPTMLKQLELLGKSVNLRVKGVRPQPLSMTPQTRRLSSGAQASEGNVEEASKTKANTTGKKTEEAPEPKPYAELVIDVELSGKYMNALDFLYRLTSFPKIVQVNSVDMKTTGTPMPGTSPALDMQINVTAFVFKDPDTGSTVDPKETPGASETASGRERRI